MNFEVSADCYNCNKTTKDNDGVFYCDKCADDLNDKNYDHAIENILDRMAQNSKHYLDGEHLVGFKNLKEKELFMRGVKEGISHSIYIVHSHLNGSDELIEKYYEIMDAIKIPVIWTDADEKYKKEE